VNIIPHFDNVVNIKLLISKSKFPISNQIQNSNIKFYILALTLI